MHTLNARQLRALAIVTPGTLAIRDDSNYARMVFQTSEEDRERSGVERIEVDQHGNVTEHLTMGREPITTSYSVLVEKERLSVTEFMQALPWWG